MIKPKWLTLALSLLGVGGVGLTSWLSVKCHDKAKGKKTKKEKIKAYIPAIASGIGTSACILGSHGLDAKEIKTLTKQVTALTGTCAYLTANRDKLEQKFREVVGEDKAKEIKGEVKKELIKERKKDPNTIIEKTGYGNVHFVESILGREFYCSLEHVDWSFKRLNQMFKNGQDVNMSTLYELWGLKKTRSGFDFGWPEDTDYDFGYSPDEPIHHEIITGEDENGDLMYWIDIRTTPPIYGYLEE